MGMENGKDPHNVFDLEAARKRRQEQKKVERKAGLSAGKAPKMAQNKFWYIVQSVIYGGLIFYLLRQCGQI